MYTSNVKTVEGYIDDWEAKALKAIGMFIDGEAVLRCPAGSYDKGGFAGSGKIGGNLQGSIRHVVDREHHFVRIGTRVDYSIYVEKGTGVFSKNSKAKKIPWHYQDDMGVWHTTSGMPAQPFLTPAAEENVNEIKEIVRRVKFANGIK
jgi:HK97 gp10 family phage protein